MGLITHSFQITPTPSGVDDGHFPDGNDGTAAIPLTWADIPSSMQNQEGTPLSDDLSVYLTQPGGPNATITKLSGTWPAGWAINSAGVRTYSGTGQGTGTIRLRATRLGHTGDSKSFKVQSIAAIVSADVQAPTPPSGIHLVSQTASPGGTATLACDVPMDAPTALIPADGMKEVRWLKAGVLDGAVSAVAAGVKAILSKVDIMAASGREMTVGTLVAITPTQRANANGIPNAGVIADAGPACTNVKGFLLRKTWGTELELTPNAFTVTKIKKELADCASFTPKMKLWVMVVDRTFEVPVNMTFSASVGSSTSGTLSPAVPAGQYGVEFSNGTQRNPVTVAANGTSVSWSGALPSGSILTAKAMKYANNPMPTDMKALADPFTGNVGLGGGWQDRVWHPTVVNRFDKLQKGMYLALKDDANYDCFAGICTQETSTGSPPASTGYTFLAFADALMARMDSIANAFPTKRQTFFFNSISGTNNAQFNELMGMSTTTGLVPGVPAGREGVLQHALKLGVVVGFPDTVLKTGSLTSRNYLLVKAYHDAGGFTMGSIQGAEFTGIPPGDTPTPRPMVQVFGYLVGNPTYKDDNAANPLKVDCICPDYHPAGGPAGDLDFVTDCVPLIKSATYNAPYGTISVPSSMPAGTVVQSGLDYTVTSSGAGLGATADEWTAASFPIDGDFSLTAELNSITGNTAAAIGGIGIRDGDALPGSRAAHLVVTTTRIRALARLTPNGPITAFANVAGQNNATAKFLRVERVGNLITYKWSADNKAWNTASANKTVTMGNSVLAQLFTAPGSGAACAALFKNVCIQNQAGVTHVFTGLAAGTYALTAKGRDLANNDSAATPTVSVVIA